MKKIASEFAIGEFEREASVVLQSASFSQLAEKFRKKMSIESEMNQRKAQKEQSTVAFRWLRSSFYIVYIGLKIFKLKIKKVKKFPIYFHLK